MKMKRDNLIRFIFAVIIAGLVDDLIHTYYGHLVAPETVQLYTPYIMDLSYLTKPLQALGAAIVFYLLGDRLGTHCKFLQAIYLTLLLCLIKDGLIRQPVMNSILGNPILNSILRETEVWFSTFGMCLVLAFMISPLKNSETNVNKFL